MRGCLHLATTEKRSRPRRAGKTTTTAASTRKTSRGSTRAAAKPKPSPARQAAPRSPRGRGKDTEPRAPSRSKRPPTPPRPQRKQRAPARVVDEAVRLHGIVRGALEDLKARDVTEIDVRGKSGVTDLLVIASGTSSRHVKSIADEVVRKAKQAGLPPIGVEGHREAEWVLVDLGDIVVHVMLPRAREYYGLERLWSVDEPLPEALAV